MLNLSRSTLEESSLELSTSAADSMARTQWFGFRVHKRIKKNRARVSYFE